MSSFKDIFKGFSCFQGFLTIFLRLGEHVSGIKNKNLSNIMKKLIYGSAETQLKGYECYIQYNIYKIKALEIKNR